jgi:hypothetical protein
MAVQIFFVWAAVHYVLAARTLKRDLYQPMKREAVSR